MKLVYVAGKYSDKTLHDTFDNVRTAEKVARDLWKEKIPCICPHKNAEMFDDIASWKTFMDGSIEILKRCDALLAVSNWKNSKGAKLEIKYAQKNNIPVFFKTKACVNWINKNE
jgi:hypothetical protein